ncbi:hypothetical protein CDV55_106038 [Aspergillus turcosus]|nr:hypothetical protein CDV55_106038 [Aspergillus turcosus]
MLNTVTPIDRAKHRSGDADLSKAGGPALPQDSTCLAIHRCFHAYLNSRRSEPLDHATLIAILLRELENLEKQVEREFQEPSQLVIQSRDSLLSSILPKFDDIEKRLEQVGADTLELRRRIIRLHDKVLSMSSELREMHAAQYHRMHIGTEGGHGVNHQSFCGIAVEDGGGQGIRRKLRPRDEFLRGEKYVYPDVDLKMSCTEVLSYPAVGLRFVREMYDFGIAYRFFNQMTIVTAQIGQLIVDRKLLG